MLRLGAERFPKTEVVKATHTKETLRINPNARYLMTLHEQAIKENNRKCEELKKRNVVTLDAFDWNMVKKISSETPFAKYIEIMKGRGHKHFADDSSVSAELLLDPHAGSVKRKSSTKQSSVLDEPDQELIEKMKQFLSASPFQVKPKGQSPKQKYFQDKESNWTFGRPPALDEEFGAEFIRAFNELETLGTTIQYKRSALEIDTEMFQIAPNIAAVIEAMGSLKNQKFGHSQIIAGAAKEPSTRKGKVASTEVLANQMRQEFNEEREFLFHQLVKSIKQRDLAKLNLTLNTQDMAKTVDSVMKYVALNSKAKHTIAPSSVPAHPLWVEEEKNLPYPRAFVFTPKTNTTATFYSATPSRPARTPGAGSEAPYWLDGDVRTTDTPRGIVSTESQLGSRRR
ncbi:hypothetical protein HDV03_001600 [Kappamyces sp. JEL0829]|nr:hypothetical protein HDV03_001600 [Kappamyces sp. JEL0829]